MRGAEVRHGLDDAVVEVKRGLDQVFAIAGYGGAAEGHRGVLVGHEAQELSERLLDLSERVTVIV